MRAGGIFLLSFIALFAPLAAGEPLVYHSPGDDGTIPGATPTLPSPGPEWVYLYADAGSQPSAPGTACTTGTGDELCAWNLLIEGQGVEFLEFQGTGGVVWNLTPGSLRVNGVDAIAPTPDPIRLGQLRVVSTSPAGGSVLVSGVDAATAALELATIPSGTLAFVPVPEPGGRVMLVSGILAVCAMSRSRRARQSR